MKKLLFILLVSATALTSCKNEKCCILPDAPFFISASKNTTDWSAAGTAEKLGTDSLLIVGSKTEERLLMHIKFTGKGVYTFHTTQVFYFTTVGQDVFTSEYYVDESAPNTLAVEDYNPDSKRISGSYSLTLKKTHGITDPAYPESLKFVNGRFNIKLP